jgi:hypothetical protein
VTRNICNASFYSPPLSQPPLSCLPDEGRSRLARGQRWL